MVFNQDDYFKNTFSKLSLSRQNIREIEFEDCTFNRCSFVNSTFLQCKFIHCVFQECMLSAVLPTNCHFIDVSFVDSKVIGIDWTKAQQVQNLSFKECQINYSNFRMLKLPKTKMVDCEAKEVDFVETNLSNSELTNTDFERSIFSKTNLTKANLVGAKNYLIDARSNTIKKARFALPEALSLLDSLDIIIETV
ncbi:MAG: pentapeptide repeat-containing protein [Candidatus Roizmanbacteria bacterium]|nr:pentapeptide repeat-containing protein [Candidatus Roizmanbacteria bacterium]